MARPTLSASLVALALVTIARAGWASAWPASLSLQVTTCPGAGLDAGEVEPAVRAELEIDGAVQIEAPASRAPVEAALSLNLGCDPQLTTQVALKSRRTGRERRRSLTLADADRTARVRALSLAVSELVRSDWPALDAADSTSNSAAYPDVLAAAASQPPTDSAPPGADAKIPEPQPLRPAARRAQPAADSLAQAAAGTSQRLAPTSLALTAKTRWFVDYASASFGGDVGPDFGSLRVRAEALFGSATDALGSAAFGSAALCVGYRVIDVNLGALSVAGYPLVSAGATWLRGTSAAASVQVDPTSGLYGDLRFLLEARSNKSRLSPSLAAEVGRASGFVARSGNRTLGASGGFFLGASLGARY